jgi:predicted nucleotidyltransferase
MLREESFESVRTISSDRGKLLTRLREIVTRMEEATPEVVEVRLLGSVARQTETGVSDFDLLVLLRDEPNDRVEWTQRLLQYFDLPVGVDLLIYGEGEFRTGLSDGNPVFRRMSAESKPL